MKKGYYWIPQTDMTLNSQQFYKASVIGDIIFDWKRGVVVFELDRFFPVGSVFHFMHNEVEYKITCRLRKPGLHYEAKREDGCKINASDIERFNSGRYIYRTGFKYEDQ